MVPFFVQIKCHLGKSYQVANALADAEIASEIYSTAGDFDLLVKFYVEDATDIGHFINEKVQVIPASRTPARSSHSRRLGNYAPVGGPAAARAFARSSPIWRSRQITNSPEPATITAPI